MGSGFRVWTAGEVVSASNVNNYLQEQTVMSFAGTAARSSAIASPEEGMLSYLQDSDTYQGYDGSAWVNLGTLSGASDSGLIHIVEVSDTAVSAINVDDCFSADYTHYKIIINLKSTTTVSCNLRLRVAGSDNSSAIYRRQRLTAENTTLSGARSVDETSWASSVVLTATSSLTEIEIANPFQTEVTAAVVRNNYVSDGNITSSYYSLGINSTLSFTGFSITPQSSTVTGRIDVLGYARP